MPFDYNAHRAKMQRGYYVRADPRPRHASFLSNLKPCIFQGVKNGPAMLHGASGATRKGKHFLIRHKQKQKMKKLLRIVANRKISFLEKAVLLAYQVS